MKFRLCLTAIALVLMIVSVANAAPKTSPTLQSQITAQLSHPEPWVQARACYLLGNWNMRAAAPVLTRILNDSKRNQLVRLHAGLALGRLNQPTGRQFCADIAAKRGWHRVAKAEIAQTELVTALAENVSLGLNTNLKPQSSNLFKAIEASQNMAVAWRDAGWVLRSDQLLVLLDRYDTEAWGWLSQDFKDMKNGARTAAIKAAAKRFS